MTRRRQSQGCAPPRSGPYPGSRTTSSMTLMSTIQPTPSVTHASSNTWRSQRSFSGNRFTVLWVSAPCLLRTICSSLSLLRPTQIPIQPVYGELLPLVLRGDELGLKRLELGNLLQLLLDVGLLLRGALVVCVDLLLRATPLAGRLWHLGAGAFLVCEELAVCVYLLE